MRTLPEITHSEVLRRLQLEIEQIGSASALARTYGVSPRLMQSIMTGHRNVCPKLLRKLGLRRVTLVVHRYEALKKGKAVTECVRKTVRKGERIPLE